MNYSKEIGKKIIWISISMMVIGFVIAALGFSMSGMDYEKYQTDHKKWYQVISIPKD
ncbi:hypothetical protein [Vagococcus hydrophili]|uniref:Uncharacterized protein n=1 Tax=Vagococcus hydrophili TaxID=2714947 RepID=A0A6G8AVX5_9ENTE|nr:hypothetical protein [Vagococcus hydrophili]QIL49147.1 hypothetical protein G7082_11940 [Vagococcus hydrophili]